jgi:hypothetical protein
MPLYFPRMRSGSASGLKPSTPKRSIAAQYAIFAMARAN